MNYRRLLLTQSGLIAGRLALAACCLLIACRVPDMPPPPDPPRPPVPSAPTAYPIEDAVEYAAKKKIIFVLVDLTTQAEANTHIAELSQKVGQIIESAPFGSTVSIYPIDRAPHVPPILEFTAPAQPRNTNQKKKARDVLASNRDSAVQAIHALFEKVYLPASNLPASCLVHSLSSAHGMFSRFENSGDAERELILLSDMVEECDHDGFGLVSMNKHRNTFPDFLKQFRPTYDLGYADLSIVMSTQPHLSQSHGVPVDTLAGYWRQVFRKIGFSEEAAAGIVFNTRLPDRYVPSETRWK